MLSLSMHEKISPFDNIRANGFIRGYLPIEMKNSRAPTPMMK